MQCPVDGETLVMTERSGVEIDYCPKCRGVWLDRGELDKIIDRAAPPEPPVVMQPPPQPGFGAPQGSGAFAPAPAAHPAAAPDLHGAPQFRGEPGGGRPDEWRSDDRRPDDWRHDERREAARYGDRHDGRRRDRDRDDDDDDDRRYRKRKRESFLSDLFDF